MTFDSDLKAGQAAEDYLATTYPQLKKSEDRKWDLQTDAGIRFEIKLERRATEKLKNLFVETISNESKQSLGGPARALSDNVEYFGWLINDSKKLYLFETVKLCEELDRIISEQNLSVKRIPNRGYTTLGYAVKIELLTPYCVNIEDILK